MYETTLTGVYHLIILRKLDIIMPNDIHVCYNEVVWLALAVVKIECATSIISSSILTRLQSATPVFRCLWCRIAVLDTAQPRQFILYFCVRIRETDHRFRRVPQLASDRVVSSFRRLCRNPTLGEVASAHARHLLRYGAVNRRLSALSCILPEPPSIAFSLCNILCTRVGQHTSATPHHKPPHMPTPSGVSPSKFWEFLDEIPPPPNSNLPANQKTAWGRDLRQVRHVSVFWWLVVAALTRYPSFALTFTGAADCQGHSVIEVRVWRPWWMLTALHMLLVVIFCGTLELFVVVQTRIYQYLIHRASDKSWHILA